MTAIQHDSGVFLSGVTHLNLAETLDCGQAFRWIYCGDGTWSGIASNRKLSIQETTGGLFFHGITLDDFENFWRGYFDLNTDYGDILQRFLPDDALKKAVAKFSGIRILRQNPEEATFSFIISQNNNIPRIKKIIETMCRLYGEQLNETDFAFPTAEAIAARTEEELCRQLHCGYRGKYLVETARSLCQGHVDFNHIASLPLNEAEKKLCELKGVGPKVAQCILLYGLHRTDAFPVDVWVKRIMERFYPHGFPHMFNDVAGIAQQYLFHYIRNES